MLFGELGARTWFRDSPIVRRVLGPFAALAILALAPGHDAARAEPVRCHPSYPDVCIPPPPPDLDCPDLDECDIRVVGSDPHRLDRDHDGIGCECR